MGYTMSNGKTRRQVVAEQCGPWETVNGDSVVALRTHRTGNEDWFLYVVHAPSGEEKGRFIAVTIWEGLWHKEMEESVGPYYYGCPPEWLALVPCPDNDWARGWREKVRNANRPVAA